tara:strand:- start:7 stop:141 length:135 start_codon:yes stop_codon:yes gene_type:complete
MSKRDQDWFGSEDFIKETQLDFVLLKESAPTLPTPEELEEKKDA